MYSCIMVNSDYISGKPAVFSEVCFTKISDLFYKNTKNAVASYIALDEKTDNTVSKNSKPIDDSDSIFVFLGAFPFVTDELLRAVYEQHIEAQNKLTVLTVADSERDNEQVSAGIFLFNKDLINDFFDVEKSANDLIKIGEGIDEYEIDEISALCVYDCLSLADASNVAHTDSCVSFMSSGVVLVNPESIFISESVSIKPGTTIMPNTIIKGNTIIGENCIIGPNSQITDCEIGDGVTINSSVLVESKVMNNATVGPFAYIRPNSKIGCNVKIGDFVEVKNSTIDDNTKVAHLTYVGDADVGKRVNFGCGTVLVNYDGQNKFRSVIHDDVFIGCNTNLVSPVTVNSGAFIAAGSTITDDIPDNSLAIARARQVNKTGWKKK